MEMYLLKFSACLAVFWLIYVLFLERHNMHLFKRFYLLGALASAIIIPLLTITHYIEPVVTDFEVSQVYLPMESSFLEIPTEPTPFLDLETVLWIIYGLGVLLFSIRFIINLFKMYKRISNNETVTQKPFIYVLLEECRIPHSFFKYIFFDQLKYETHTIPEEVKLHEETHAKQLHSLDIVMVELLQIVFWFHPLIYILKHHIKLNHEFLADQAVLKKGIDTKSYQNTLLQFSSNTDEYHLSSAINYSSIKKRFTVMKTQTSKTRIWVSSLLLLPIIAILFYSFAEKEYVERYNQEVVESIESEIKKANELQLIYTDPASEALMQEYHEFIESYKKTKIIIGDKYERAIIVYDELMSPKQRESVEKYPKRLIPESNLSKTTPRKLTLKQFEAFKDAKTYAIWIDNKHVTNSTLNNYSANNFVHFTGSIVHKNARSKKFPQPNQYHLYTKAGFKTIYQDSQFKKYEKLSKEYSSAISEYLKESQTDNSELKILKVQAEKLYKSFTKKELKNNNILPPPPVPVQKKASYSKSKSRGGPNASASHDYLIPPPIPENATPEERKKMQQAIDDFEKKYKRKVHTGKMEETGELISLIANDEDYEGKNMQQKVTEEEVVAYNAWAKKIHSESKPLSEDATWFPPIDQQKLIKFSEIYKRMSPQQINQSIEFPFPGLDGKTTKQQIATKKQVAEYNAWAKKINTAMAKAEQNNDVNAYPIVKLKEVNKYKAIYNIMTAAQKKASEAWPSFPPPPPPPPPPAPEKPQDKSGPIIINGATYYFIQQNGKTTYFDRYGKVVDINKIPPPPPIPNDATPEQKAKMKKAPDAYMKAHPDKVGKVKLENGEEIDVVEVPSDLQGSVDINGETFYYTTSNGKTTYFNRYGKEVKMDNLPPPPPAPPAPESTLDFVIRMAKNNAKFFNERKSISSDEAIALLKKNPKLNVTGHKTETKQPLVYITKKPIHIGVKGKGSKKEKGGPNSSDLSENFYDSETKKEYIKKYKQYETLRYAKPHFLKKPKSDKKLMSDLWVELRQMYFYSLSKKEKTNLKLPITPFAPYVKINKDGKSYYKVFNKLTPGEEETLTLSPKPSATRNKSLELLSDTDPVVIPIGTYELSKTPIEKDNKKRSVLISISEDGIYAISKDNTLKNFETASLATLEALLSKLTKDEIENTFVFAQNKDAKQFRSKPANSPEYQDDIEVMLVKDDIRFTTMEYNGKYTEHPSYQLVLDNGASNQLKSHVSKLAKLFKKYGISSLTI